MRQYFFELVSLLLFGGALVFFLESLSFLSKRDYVAAIILTVIGFAVISTGKELARLALVQKD